MHLRKASNRDLRNNAGAFSSPLFPPPPPSTSYAFSYGGGGDGAQGMAWGGKMLALNP